MTTENDRRICPTCKRRGSERNIDPNADSNMTPFSALRCPDPYHDVADAASEMLDVLEEFGKLSTLAPEISPARFWAEFYALAVESTGVLAVVHGEAVPGEKVKP